MKTTVSSKWVALRRTQRVGLAAVIVAATLTVALLSVAAAPGDLDLGFGFAGRVVTDFGGTDQAQAVVVQADGKIILAGGSRGDFALARYNPDGGLDGSYGIFGRVVTDFGASEIANAAALQANGRLVVAGTTSARSGDFVLARYNTDGTLDQSFGFGGRVITDFGSNDAAFAITIGMDGKIIVAGSTRSDLALARYNADGTLDPTFGIFGRIVTDFGSNEAAYAVAIQGDGKVVAAGTTTSGSGDFILARYNRDGTLDGGFGFAGRVTTDFGSNDNARALVIQPDGKIIVAGYKVSSTDFALARYNPDGTLDQTFGIGGRVITDFGASEFAFAIVLQVDGKPIVAGYASFGSGSDFAVARYNPDGTLDAGFGTNGRVITDFGNNDIGCAAVLQADGKLVVAGYAGNDFAVARYTGTLPQVVTPTPYGGTPRLVPGLVQAEDYDVGGQGVAYFDMSPGNIGEQYRTDDVDIKTSTDGGGGGHAVGWFNAGEWLTYTIDIEQTANYDIVMRVGSQLPGRTFRIEIGGRDVAGLINVPQTAEWDQYQTVTVRGVALQGGRQTMRVVMGTEDYMDLNWISIVPRAFNDTPHPIPGLIQAENYDEGGQGVGYNDATPGNVEGVYRSDDVDIKESSDEGGGHTVGYFNAGEWLRYTVDVQQSGTYDIEVRVGAAYPDRTFRIEVNGRDVTGQIGVPNLGEWDRYETLRIRGVALTSGRQVVRVRMGTIDYMDINWINFVPQAAPQTAPETAPEVSMMR